jgi:hypothetical protein
MTLKMAQKIAHKLGFTIRKTNAGDYRLNTKGGPEKYAVYEANVNDAFDTMMYIVKSELVKREVRKAVKRRI